MTKRVKWSVTAAIVLMIAGMIVYPQIKSRMKASKDAAEVVPPAGSQVRKQVLNINAEVLKYQSLTDKTIVTGSTIPDEEVDLCFNPRTYIRYDCIANNANIYSLLSMPLCDNKLFGFFIDEIKLIGVFNRLIINDCETFSFLLMLNVRKQLYYKFVFYIIGCDDAYVFNSFRIIISQEIETDTIFFMIDDIQ